MFKSLGLFVAFTSLIFLSSCKSEETKTIYWDLQSQASATSLDFLELKKFADNIKVMSAGRLVITPHAGGEITNGPDIYSAVSEGRIQMGNGWPNWWSGQNPAWAVMNARPFGFMNLDASMMFFLTGDGTKLANELSSKQGIIWRPAWWPGMELGLLSKEPIQSLQDLKGKTVRIGPGIPSEVLAEASGAFTIPLIPQEIIPALENGDIDAVEWTTPRGALDLGFHGYAPHAIVPAIWQPSVLSDFLINEAAYAALDDDLKAILETGIKSYTLMTTMSAKVADFEAYKELEKQGVVFKKWSDADIEKWRHANNKVINVYREDPYTRKLIDAKTSFKKRYLDYYQYFDSYE